MENERILTKEEIEIRRVKMMQKAAWQRLDVQKAIQLLVTEGLMKTSIKNNRLKITWIFEDY